MMYIDLRLLVACSSSGSMHRIPVNAGLSELDLGVVQGVGNCLFPT